MITLERYIGLSYIEWNILVTSHGMKRARAKYLASESLAFSTRVRLRLNAHMHARHFSSPFSGTIEDPVTGTASGVMGAYYARYINKHAPSLSLLIEQGHEIGRDGKIRVCVTDNGNVIEVTGNAVYVNEFDVLI